VPVQRSPGGGARDRAKHPLGAAQTPRARVPGRDPALLDPASAPRLRAHRCGHGACGGAAAARPVGSPPLRGPDGAAPPPGLRHTGAHRSMSSPAAHGPTGRPFSDIARAFGAGEADAQAVYEAFLGARFWCEAGDSPGVEALGSPGAGVVPVFTSEAELAQARGAVRWL